MVIANPTGYLKDDNRRDGFVEWPDNGENRINPTNHGQLGHRGIILSFLYHALSNKSS